MLINLSVDCTELITEYLTYVEISKLVMCGSRNLNFKFFNATKRIQLVWRGVGPVPWPDLVTKFRSLKSFSLITDYSSSGMPCRRPKLGDLPKTIESLHFRIYDPVSVIFEPFIGDDGFLAHKPYDFERHLPNLTSLKLSGNVQIRAEEVKLLPASLTELDLSSSVDFDGIPLLKFLPKSLKQLNIGSLLPCTDLDEFIFPPQLERLDFWLTNQDSSWFVKLPKTLTELSIIVWEALDNFASNWKHLPRGLKSFSLWCSDVTLTEEYLAFDLPPQLESLDIELKEEEFKTEWLKQLPRSITHLELSSSSYFHNNDVHLIPSSSKHIYLENSTLTPLPSTLAGLTLHSGLMTLADAECLPSQLITLSLDTINDEIAHSLSRLPQLAYVTIHKGVLSPKGCEALPRSMRTMTCHPQLFSSLDCLEKLPPIIGLTLRSDADSEHCPISLTAAASSMLPPTLRRFTIFSDLLLTAVWMHGLAKHQGLEYILASYSSRVPESVLFHLPPNLTSISLSVTTLSEKCFASLPRGLRTLDISGNFSTQPNAHHFADLPRSLLNLSLPRMSEQTSRAALEYLPPYLYSFKSDWSSVPWFDNKFDPWKSYRHVSAKPS